MITPLIRPVTPPHTVTSGYGPRILNPKSAIETKVRTLLREKMTPEQICAMVGITMASFKKMAPVHTGIDYIGRDFRVYAICDGIVIKDFDDYDPRKRWTDRRHSAGNYVLISSMIHGKRIYHRYVHLGENNVDHGQPVKQGEQIGLYADVGQSFGAHLHFDMYDENWNKPNPEPIMIQGLKASGLA